MNPASRQEDGFMNTSIPEVLDRLHAMRTKRDADDDDACALTARGTSRFANGAACH